MNKNGWKVGDAKQQIEVLRRSESAPQLTCQAKAATVSERVTIGDRFKEARELLRRENYRLTPARRRSRSQ